MGVDEKIKKYYKQKMYIEKKGANEEKQAIHKLLLSEIIMMKIQENYIDDRIKFYDLKKQEVIKA